MSAEQFSVVNCHLLWFQKSPRAGSKPEARHSQVTSVRLFEAPADLVTRVVIGVCGRLRGSEVDISGV